MGVMRDSWIEGQDHDAERLEAEEAGARKVHREVDPTLRAWPKWAAEVKARLLVLLSPLLGPELAARTVNEIMNGRPGV
jgi:hypothetical protein